MNYYLVYFLLLLKSNDFELWSAWYKSYTGKSLFSLILVIRYFRELRTLNFIISMSASSYEWNALHPSFLNSVNITFITQYLFTIFLKNTTFFSWSSMSNGSYACYQLWLLSKLTSQPFARTTNLWNNRSETKVAPALLAAF